jgi:hypothetical protein
MSTLTGEQITRARHEKKRYLLSVLLMVCANGFNMLLKALHSNNQTVQTVAGLCGVAALAYGVVMTWRLCRSINIGIKSTVVATVLAPFFFLFELVVLLRIYAKRTGLGLTFMMGDKDPQQSIAG